MVYISPYDTNYGKLINISKIKESLVKFEMLHKNDNLNYEFANGDNYKLMFITGKNDDEKDLPIWNHPLVFQNIDKQNIIAVDVRKYCRQEIGINLTESIKDMNNFNFLKLNALIIGDFIDGNYGVFANIQKNITLGFSTLLAGVINSIVTLDPMEKVNIEIISNVYANLLFIDGNEEDHLDNIIMRCSKTKFSVPVSFKYIEQLFKSFDINYYPKSYVELIENIKVVLGNKAQLIDSNIVINALSNVWYGHGSTESVMIGLEHMPTWISLMYTSVENRSYKRTRLAMILEKGKRNIKPDEIIKTIDLYIKDKTML